MRTAPFIPTPTRARKDALAAGFVGLAATLLVLATACGPLSGLPSEEELIQESRDRFVTAVAAERDFDVYWLGHSFEVNGMTWEGPEVPGFDEVSRDSLETDYVNLGSTCCGTVSVDMYTEAAWELVQQRRGPLPRRFDVKQVQVGQYTGELRTGRGDVNPIADQILVLHLGGTIVEASTGAVVPRTPTPSQPNPLIDEATFLSVLEQLRPYPE